MANKRIGSMPAHTTVIEKIDSAKQLVPADSGKLFLCYTDNLDDYVVNLPKLTEDIAGWQAKFLLLTVEAATAGTGALSVLAYGMTAADTSSGVADANTVYGIDISGTYAHISAKDGVEFGDEDHGPAIMEFHTDGTYWYAETQSSADVTIAAIGS